MSTVEAEGGRRTAAGALLSAFVASGAVVLVGFFFPGLVGGLLGGQTWLVVALSFFGSGLGYLAVLPHDTDAPAESSGSTLLAIRRGSVRSVLSDVVAAHDPVILGLPIVVFTTYFALQLAFPAGTTAAIDGLSRGVLRGMGPALLGVALLAVLYCGALLLGPWGDIKLGGEDATPAYTYPTYFSLIFTAGIAAGIVFWGPAEALFHYQQPPPYFDAAPGSSAAVNAALVYSLFHWGVSAWAAYAAVGIPIAYFVFQRGAPLRVSSILTPFLGADGLDSPWSRLVDTLAVFATIGGIATSLGLISQQFLVGVAFQWGVPPSNVGPVLLVGGLAAVFVLSAVSGLHRGIRRISGLTLVLFGLFAALLLTVGPRGFVVDRGTAALGAYAINFLPMSLFSSGAWVTEWTVWNWAWWFSWAPFAGTFIAALSRGRRIRTVVFTSVVATSAATSAWFLIFGGTALSLQRNGAADALAAISDRGGSEAVAGFPLLSALPLGELLLFLFLSLIVVFIVTSADTSTLVAAVLASKRGIAPSRGSIVLWGTFQAAVALSVLLVGGGETLQALAVLTGAPFAVLTVLALIGLSTALYRDERGQGHTSIVRQALDRLPTIRTHHDVDPPDRES
ncbi:BCCT family transporter [Halobellus ruber]|uniref:BCCT family transporter n=1 Tax=Halobellus ruber TaxID=2761102 RepID=A0A7J9SNC2_9EURY|nr:BCCT family transporter [Halobellus ruber]MBB6646651.1 BCCT family transporter [Halobellus ruber]